MEKNPTILLVVAVALINPVGEVLMQSRPPGRSMAGLWEFPGGKVEAGETPEAALIREIGEELGVTLRAGDLRAGPFASEALGDRQLLLCLYIADRWSGTPAAREGQEVQWVAPEKLAALDMPPADYPLVEMLLPILAQES